MIDRKAPTVIAEEAGPDQRLDTLLARWADSVRLPAARADEMLTAIVSTPAPQVPRPRLMPLTGLSGSWWRGRSADLAATVARSTRVGPVAA
jgi:hypothetical protein